MLIIPTYQERDNIVPLVTRVRESVGPLPILFVDDSSPDGTAEVIRNLQQIDGGIKLLVRPGKGGYSSACIDGMKLVLRESLADYMIFADGDLSHPPELLPRMIELLANNPVVIGSRYIPGGGAKDWGFLRRRLSHGANLYARALTGVPVHDMTAGFVGYRTEALRAINLDAIHSEGYSFLMEMKVSLHLQGIHFCEFPITFVGRQSGESKFDQKILLEGVRYPLTVFAGRLRGLIRPRDS
jgi:dolichol-phosphate mannosyltransferase